MFFNEVQAAIYSVLSVLALLVIIVEIGLYIWYRKRMREGHVAEASHLLFAIGVLGTTGVLAGFALTVIK